MPRWPRLEPTRKRWRRRNARRSLKNNSKSSKGIMKRSRKRLARNADAKVVVLVLEYLVLPTEEGGEEAPLTNCETRAIVGRLLRETRIVLGGIAIATVELNGVLRHGVAIDVAAIEEGAGKGWKRVDGREENQRPPLTIAVAEDPNEDGGHHQMVASMSEEPRNALALNQTPPSSQDATVDEAYLLHRDEIAVDRTLRDLQDRGEDDKLSSRVYSRHYSTVLVF